MKNVYIKFFIIVVVILFISFYIIPKNKVISKRINKNDENIELKSNEIIKQNNEEKIKYQEYEIKELKPISFDASVPIFMYHWIREDTGDYPWPENMIRPDTLKEQINYLIENNFEFIYITDLEKIYGYTKPIALTFDDGWEDVYIHMFPIAKEKNIKYSMYIIKDMVGKPGYCNEEQIKEMIESGFCEIESHTVTHPYLSKLSYDKQEYELIEAKKYLKEVYNINSKVICYPYGDYNNNTIQISKDNGYLYGLKMNGGVYNTSIHTDKYEIPRIYANRSMNIEDFKKYANQSKVNVIWEE